MKFTEEIIIQLESEFPELKDLNIHIGNKNLDFSSRQKLTPYLIFKNTLDNNRRFIRLYHPIDSEYYRLIPLYVVIALYKKAIANSSETMDLESTLKDNKFYLNGGLCHFKSLDFEKREIIYKTPRTTAQNLNFDEIRYRLSAHSESQKQTVNTILDLIKRNELKAEGSIRGILKNRRFQKKLKLNSGVLIFTNKTKFTSLLSSIKVGDVKIGSTIHIKSAIWNKKDSTYKYKSITSFQEDAPLILIASYLDITAIEEFLDKFKNIDTVIFDDADQNDTHIQKIESSVYEKLHSEKSLMDVYFVKSDKSFYEYRDIKRKYPKSHFWITTNQDFSDFNDERVFSHKIDSLNEAIPILFDLKKKMKMLFEFNVHPELISLYRDFQSLEVRFKSFYFLDDYLNSIKEFLKKLKTYLVFLVGQESFFDLYDPICNGFEALIEYAKNQKANKIIELAKNLDNSIKRILIISNNKNKTDRAYLLKELSGIKHVEFSDFNFFEQKYKRASLIVCEPKIPLSNTVWYETIGEEIHFVLNSHEHKQLIRIGKFTENVINEMTSIQNRCEILNLNESSKIDKISKGSFQLNSSFLNESKIKINPKINFEKISKNDLGLMDYAFDRMIEHGSKNGQMNFNKDMYLIGFSDGTFDFFNSDREFYLSIESDEDSVSDIGQLRRKVKYLNPGDEILFFKSSDYEELVEVISNKILDTPSLRKKYMKAESWREVLKKMVDIAGGNLAFKEILEKTAGINRSKQTIKNWYTGYTRVPSNFMDLLIAIEKLSQVKKSMEEFELQHPLRVIYTEAKNFRRYFSKVPRRIRQMVIAKKYNIPISIEVEFEDLIENLAEEIDIKEIIRVEKCQSYLK